jgi:thiol-disulfide isomerase/thioredoxin
VIGKKFDASGLGRWLNVQEGGLAKPQAGRVTLYRWWTDECPFCAATLPAIEGLRKKYEPQGLAVVAVYHPKPPRAVSDEAVREAAKKIGYHGLIAVDEDWAVLRKVWLDTGRRSATSVSFLVDGEGVIRFVHPGVEFFPSDKSDEKQQDEDYRAMEKAIMGELSH